MRICCATCQHWKTDTQDNHTGICKFRPPSWMRVHQTNRSMLFDEDCDFYSRNHNAELDSELVFE